MHDGALELFGECDYAPKVRSPRCIALLDQVEVEDFVMEVRLKQTGRDYGHRDMCIFFGFEGPSRYYYVHLASKADDHAHNIFLVDNAARRKIATRTTEGVDWGRDLWHRVLVERRASDGLIAVYFDSEAEPIMIAHDRTLGWGRVGVGSFDDTGMVDYIQVRTGHVRRARSPVFTDGP